MDNNANSSRRRTPNTKRKVTKVNSKENLSISELKLLYQRLKKQNTALDKEIAELKEKGVTEDLKPEMQALHEYNDIKDVAQMVLGYLSDAENCTVAELHRRYSLPLE